MIKVSAETFSTASWKLFWYFSYFTKFSFHNKSNEAQLLVINMEYKRCRCEIFEKGHRHKMMKFLIIVYFHVSMALWIMSIFFLFNVYVYKYLIGICKFPGLSPVQLLPMCRGKLFAVISRLMSECLWSRRKC